MCLGRLPTSGRVASVRVTIHSGSQSDGELMGSVIEDWLANTQSQCPLTLLDCHCTAGCL